MTQFKKTILGKILGGAAKVVLPVVGAITGIGAISGLVKGTGALAGAAGAIKGVVKGVDKVAKSAANLVTGITAEQRGIIHTQKEETRADMQKLTAIEKLIKAGATVSQAAAKIGVPMESLTGLFGIPSTTESKEEAFVSGEPVLFEGKSKLLIYAGVGLAALFLLPKLLKGRR
jgi:hypothetical protein